MKICSVTIIYNPETIKVLQNIKKYLSSVDEAIVWDNTPDGSKGFDTLCKMHNLTLLGNGNNVGISTALNESIKYALNKGYDYILTMDQDSEWIDFDSYIKEVKSNLNCDTIIYAPQILSNDKILRVNSSISAITSGSVVNLHLAKKIGLFNENLFIDEVDNEFCYRASTNNLKIKIFQNHLLKQIFGNPAENKFINRLTSQYSPQRTYFQIRNRIWVWKRYHATLSYRYLLRTLLIQIIRRSIIICIYEDDKIKKLCSIFRGMKDGIFYRLND